MGRIENTHKREREFKSERDALRYVLVRFSAVTLNI